VDNIPRHPGQLYEAIFCFILFLILFFIWKNRRHELYNGMIFGIFLIALFGQRFLVEFVKENQETFEDSLSLNMGQILSIPLVLAGFCVLYYTFRKKERRSTFKNEAITLN
jgi:phosphatidylglycerol:prolipoprotein diacylglycerol transferase